MRALLLASLLTLPACSVPDAALDVYCTRMVPELPTPAPGESCGRLSQVCTGCPTQGRAP